MGENGIKESYLMLMDRTKPNLSLVKLFKNTSLISALNYGPYDNGHIIVGLRNGHLYTFSSSDLSK